MEIVQGLSYFLYIQGRAGVIFGAQQDVLSEAKLNEVQKIQKLILLNSFSLDIIYLNNLRWHNDGISRVQIFKIQFQFPQLVFFQEYTSIEKNSIREKNIQVTDFQIKCFQKFSIRSSLSIMASSGNLIVSIFRL